MADPDKDRVLKKTITIKRRTLKPYEKKFRRQGEYQYDLPIQSGIPEGFPKVCYDRSSKVNQRVVACEPVPSTNRVNIFDIIISVIFRVC